MTGRYRALLAATTALPLSFTALSAEAADVLTTLEADGDFETFTKAITEAGLTEALKDAGPYTVFAPTDDAFEALPKGAVDQLMKEENKARLESLLKHHVVRGEAHEARDLPETLDTMQGGTIDVEVSSQGVVLSQDGKREAVIVDGDIVADNGIIHAIDTVLVPRQTAQALQLSPGETSTVSADGRTVDPSAIDVPDGYKIEAVGEGLTYASDVAIAPDGTIFVAEAGGHTYGTKPEQAPPPRIVQVMPDGSTKVIYDKAVPMKAIQEAGLQPENLPEGLISPVTGITWHDGKLYISHRTRISTLDPETGEFKTTIGGMPSWGEFQNNKPVFGPDGKMYFVLSSQGNSGPVDEHMMEVMKAFDKPDAHEVPCEDVTLTGKNYELENKLTSEEGDKVMVGVYVPVGQITDEGQIIEGEFWCHGTMYRANPDGTAIERVAWGLRSNYGYAFSESGRLIATQNSGNTMQPRPIYDDWESVYEIVEGTWYGWPDYYSSLPVIDPRFTKPNEPDFNGEPFPHEFVLTEETRSRLLQGRDRPVDPLVKITPHAAAEGVVFGREAFGLDPENEILVAEFGAIIPFYKDPEGWPGFRVQRINLETGEITDFLANKDEKPASRGQGGGLERPIQVSWGPDGALYVVDFGVIHFDEQGMTAVPKTGVIWKVTRTEEVAETPQEVE